jgi:predicted AAA+ superfamily ATPase
MTRDLQDIIQIKRFDAMRELLAILASWSSKFMDISSIASSIAISRPTLETYINILNIMYMCDRVPAWLGSDYERIAKHDKIFMADCGLMAALLDWNIDNVLLDSDRSGKLVETFIYNELASLIDFADEKYSLYHYRDRTKREIDFIIKRHKDNSLLGIEVKSGSNVTSDAFKHLRWFKENLVDDKTKFIGMVLYSGQHYLAYKDNMHLVPISALWNG